MPKTVPPQVKQALDDLALAHLKLVCELDVLEDGDRLLVDGYPYQTCFRELEVEVHSWAGRYTAA